MRAEGVEAGIKIGMARASNGGGNGHIMLPEPSEMAEYCHERLSRLKDDKQRDFVSDMYVITRRGMSLSLGRLGYLARSTFRSAGGFDERQTMLEPDRDQIEIFVDAIFRHAKAGFVSLRALL